MRKITFKAAKQKGRRLQTMVRDKLATALGLDFDQVISAAASVTGSDVFLTEEHLHLFPYAIECKAVESLNVWQAWEQANKNAGEDGLLPALVIKRTYLDPIVVIDLDEFIKIAGAYHAAR